MITVVYCTREENKKHREHIIKSSGLHKYVEVIEIINNGESLTKCYNRGLKQAKNDIVVFCHDDITIETKQWGKKLIKMFDKNPQYGILGVAGTKHMSETGRWWDDPSKMYGRVKHTHEGKSWLSKYSGDLGSNVEEVVLVDGLFFVVDKKRIKLGFDESVEGFHFYDVDFCFRNLLEGVKVGVITNIRVNHYSIGETNNKWEENRIIFSEKYKNNLPTKVDETFENRKMRVLLTCLSFKNLTGSEISTFELAKSLINNGCEVSICSQLGEPLMSMAKKVGVKLYNLSEPPGFKLGDGKWVMNTPKGVTTSKPGVLYPTSDPKFDIIQLNHKPLYEHILKLYPKGKFINIVRSTQINLEDPLIDGRVLNYVSISEPVKEHMVSKFKIPEDKIKVIHNIVKPTKRKGYDKTITKPKEKLFVFPGTMNHYRKNSVIDAVEYTKDKGVLWLIGNDSDFGYAKQLSKDFYHVHYLGVIPNMGDIYDTCDVVFGVYLGRTLIEGLITNKECIAYDINDKGEIVDRKDITNCYDKELFKEENIVKEYKGLYIETFNK